MADKESPNLSHSHPLFLLPYFFWHCVVHKSITASWGGDGEERNRIRLPPSHRGGTGPVRWMAGGMAGPHFYRMTTRHLWCTAFSCLARCACLRFILPRGRNWGDGKGFDFTSIQANHVKCRAHLSGTVPMFDLSFQQKFHLHVNFWWKCFKGIHKFKNSTERS